MKDPTGHSEPRLAVLIDAENAPAKYADAIFKELATPGEASVRRVYGDFSGERLNDWKKVLANYALIPHQQPAYTKGKNSADIALVIDAMDLLHSARFNGFVLVSSDSDFTRLASRIREHGLDVFGMGGQQTPEAFRKACKRFIFLESLAETKKSPPPPEIAEQIEIFIRKQEEDWVPLRLIGQHIHTVISEFDPRNYGYPKLGSLVEAIKQFEVNRKDPTETKIRKKKRPQ